MAGSLGLGTNLLHQTHLEYTTISGYLWELSGTDLMPFPTGSVTDYNLAWDLDGTDYMPQSSLSFSGTEGNWEEVSGELAPIEV
tara:strand:+ start:153 stop:404 length:252 start_codon:yes stop_codon:yes gene_type:complete